MLRLSVVYTLQSARNAKNKTSKFKTTQRLNRDAIAKNQQLNTKVYSFILSASLFWKKAAGHGDVSIASARWLSRVGRVGVGWGKSC